MNKCILLAALVGMGYGIVDASQPKAGKRVLMLKHYGRDFILRNPGFEAAPNDYSIQLLQPWHFSNADKAIGSLLSSLQEVGLKNLDWRVRGDTNRIVVGNLTPQQREFVQNSFTEKDKTYCRARQEYRDPWRRFPSNLTKKELRLLLMRME